MKRKFTNEELARIAQAKLMSAGKQGLKTTGKVTANAVLSAGKGAKTSVGKKILLIGIPFIVFSAISAGKITIGQDLPIWVDMVVGGLFTLLFFQIVTAIFKPKKKQPKTKVFDLNNLTDKEREQYEFYLYKATRKAKK